MTLKTIEGTFIAPKGRFALVVGRFNSFVVESLVSGAVDALVRHGVSESDITLIRAPGAFEIPLVAQKVAQRGDFDAIIALGAVIRGGTPHFEYVAGECTKGLAQVSMEFGVPVAFGVLTVDSIEQAIERSGTKAGNKGAEAALSLREQVADLILMEKQIVMGGVKTARLMRLHPKFQPIPIIIGLPTDTETSREVVVEGQQNGLNNYLRKPFTLYSLQQKISEII